MIKDQINTQNHCMIVKSFKSNPISKLKWITLKPYMKMKWN